MKEPIDDLQYKFNYFAHLMKSLPKKWPQNFPYAPWYLDAVADQWDYVSTYDKDNHITGVLPFCIKKKMGVRMLSPPPLSPRLGPFVFYPKDLNEQEKKQFEERVLIKLVQQLPRVHHAKINWPYELTNGLPWQQLGWELKERFSFVIDLSQKKEVIWKAFKPSLRNKIRKAEKLVHVHENNDWTIPFNLTQKVFEHRKTKKQLPYAMMKRLDKAAKGQKSRKIFIATDKNNQIHAAIWLLYDEYSAYNLLLGSDPGLRSSGAVSLLLWHAIQFSKEKGLKAFDFEGSQLPGVESFFCSFGGEAKPYYQFTKTVKWLKIIKSLFS